MKNRIIIIALTLSALSSVSRAAESVSIPSDELARESVLPKFDKPDNVKNRNVVTAKKVELGLYVGSNFIEPIYNQEKFGVNFGYHFNEDSDFMVNFADWMGGRNSQYAPQLLAKGEDFSRAPDLQFSLWGDYEWDLYYGKISITKNGIMNVSVYPILGLGVTKYSNKTYPGLHAGIGQKFYFTNSLALRIDFTLQYQQQPNPFISSILATDPAPSASDFPDEWALGLVMDLGLSYIF